MLFRPLDLLWGFGAEEDTSAHMDRTICLIMGTASYVVTVCLMQWIINMEMFKPSFQIWIFIDMDC